MGQFVSRQLESLSSPELVKVQMLVYLYLARIYTPVRLHSHRVYNRIRATTPATISTRRRARHKWKWPLVPELPWPVRWWSAFSTSYMAYACLKYASSFANSHKFIDKILAEALAWTPLPASSNCLLLGRFIIHQLNATAPHVNQLTALLYSGSQLLWRAWVALMGRHYFITLFLFMLQPSEDLAEFYRRFERRQLQRSWGAHRKHQGRHRAHHGDGGGGIGCKTFKSIYEHYHTSIESELETKASQLEPERTEQMDTTGRDEEAHWTAHELFLLRVLCYQMPVDPAARRTGEPASYRLRPHRTMRAYDEMRSFIARLTGLFGSTLACLCSIGGWPIAGAILFDWSYLLAYPGCDPRLQQKQQAGRLGFWSMNIFASWHRLLASVVDGLENTVIWMELGLFVFFNLAVVFILNRDLLNYWRHLNGAIQVCLRKSKLLWHQHELYLDQVSQCQRQTLEQSVDCSLPFAVDRSTASALISDQLDLEECTRELQAECCDFFNQVKSVDLLMSDLITLAIILYIFLCAVVSHPQYRYYRATHKLDMAVMFVLVQLSAALSLTAASFYMFHLRQQCHKSHLGLCSLMAYDQSRHKRQFMTIIDFYTTQNKAFYTTLQMYPFSRRTFFNVICWILSGFLIVDSIISRRGTTRSNKFD